MTRTFTRILVPTDFSAPSGAALDIAKTLAATFGATLDVVHVMDDPLVLAAFAPEVYAPRRDALAHRQRGERVVRTAPCPVLTVRDDGRAKQRDAAAEVALSVAQL